MAKVSIVTEGPTAGFWVDTDSGQSIGIVADDKNGVYISIKSSTGEHVPLAIVADKDGKHIQAKHDGAIKMIPLDRIFGLLASS